jgi:two-component system, sensor histidine kinase PdtaS
MDRRDHSRFDRSTDRILAVMRQLRRLPPWQRYGITVILILVAVGARAALGSLLLHDATFTLFFPVVMLAALLFDWGTGIFATAVCTLLVTLFERSKQPPGLDATFLADVAVFLAVGLFTSLTLEALHRATARLVDALNATRRLEGDNRILLDELNHRVKNSMQVLSSLITLRSHRLRDPEMTAQFDALASQVQVLGRLYGRLRYTDSQAEMEAGAFLRDLVEDLKATLVGDRPITIDAAFDAAYLPVRRMIPLGLVVNELVTNAIKHAFPGQRRGTIRARLERRDGSLVLEVGDDGVGTDEDRGPQLGSRLVQVLAQQLRARIERSSDTHGTTVRLFAPLNDDDLDGPSAWVDLSPGRS